MLGHAGHAHLIKFLREFPAKIRKPSAILLISAHWEEDKATLTAAQNPALIHDYFGFPEEAYRIEYMAPGDRQLANKVFGLLQSHDLPVGLDDGRGFDHGMFVPLKIMFPQADIPCVQLSLVNNLDPALHIRIGRALAPLRRENVMVIGSGFSFHNLNAFFQQNSDVADLQNEAFQDWLIDTVTNENLSVPVRESRLIDWRVQAPYSLFCHPRAEHLLPLHVCFGLGNSAAKLIFYDEVFGKKVCGFLW